MSIEKPQRREDSTEWKSQQPFCQPRTATTDINTTHIATDEFSSAIQKIEIVKSQI